MPAPDPSAQLRHRRAIVFSLLAFLFAVVLVSGWMWLRHADSFSATGKPTAIESFLAHWARRLATPGKVERMKNPLPATPANILAGAEHYGDHCAICHADNGSGNTDFGRNMYPKVPDLRLNGTQRLSDGDLFSIIQNGVRLSGMPAFPDHTRQQLWQMVLLLRQLPHLTPAELQTIQAAESPRPTPGHSHTGPAAKPRPPH